jgi:hypothetical protein
MAQQQQQQQQNYQQQQLNQPSMLYSNAPAVSGKFQTHSNSNISSQPFLSTQLPSKQQYTTPDAWQQQQQQQQQQQWPGLVPSIQQQPALANPATTGQLTATAGSISQYHWMPSTVTAPYPSAAALQAQQAEQAQQTQQAQHYPWMPSTVPALYQSAAALQAQQAQQAQQTQHTHHVQASLSDQIDTQLHSVTELPQVFQPLYTTYR